jgi:hypothetical protein
MTYAQGVEGHGGIRQDGEEPTINLIDVKFGVIVTSI